MKQHCYRVEKGKARYCVDVEDLRAWLEKEIKKEGRNYNEAMTKEDYLYKDEFACSYHYTHKRFKELLAELEEEAGK